MAGYLWNEMLSLAGPNGRQEVGCYIYRNIYTGEERIGDSNMALLFLEELELMVLSRLVEANQHLMAYQPMKQGNGCL